MARATKTMDIDLTLERRASLGNLGSIKPHHDVVCGSLRRRGLVLAEAPGFFEPSPKLLTYTPKRQWTLLNYFANIDLSAFYGNCWIHVSFLSYTILLTATVLAMDDFDPGKIIRPMSSMDGMGSMSSMSSMGSMSSMDAMGNMSSMDGMGNMSSMSGMGNMSSMSSMGNMSSMDAMGNMSSMSGMGNMSSMDGMGSMSSMNGMGNMSSMSGMGDMSSMGGMESMPAMGSMGNMGAMPSPTREWTERLEPIFKQASGDFRSLVAYVLGGFVVRALTMWYSRRKNYAALCGMTRNLIMHCAAALPDAAFLNELRARQKVTLTINELNAARHNLARWIIMAHELAMLKARGQMDADAAYQHLSANKLCKAGEVRTAFRLSWHCASGSRAAICAHLAAHLKHTFE